MGRRPDDRHTGDCLINVIMEDREEGDRQAVTQKEDARHHTIWKFQQHTEYKGTHFPQYLQTEAIH